MGDPFDSMVPFSSSEELALFPPTAGLGSQESESSGSLRVEPTGIFLVSPPESPEANDGAPSRDNFQTPPEEAVPSSNSEEKGGDGPACDEKTVDLDRDTDFGFSETEMAQQTVAELESGGAIGGCKLVQIELPESELAEFMNWKRKLAFRARLLDEPPAKQLVLEKSSSFDPHGARAGTGIVEKKSRDKMVMPMKDLKSCSVIPRSESPGAVSLQMKDQMLIKSKGCTKVVSLDSEAVMVKNGLGSNDSTEDAGGLQMKDQMLIKSKGCTKVVSLDSEAVMVKNGLGSNDSTEDAGAEMAKTGLDLKDCTMVVSLDSAALMVKNGLESNDDSEAVRLVSGGKGIISEAVMAKNDSTEDAGAEMAKTGMDLKDCTQVVSLDSEAVMVKNGLESNDDSEAVRLVSRGKGTISEVVMAKNGSGSNDSTEEAGSEMAKTSLGLKDNTEVLRLGSGEKGQGIAKDGSKSVPLTQVVILDPEHNDQVSDEDTTKPGLAQGNSTEVIVLDSDDSDVEGLVIDEAFSKHGLGSNDPTEVVEDEGLVSSAGLPNKRPALNYGAEKVDKAPNTGRTEILMHKGQAMGGAEKVDKAPNTGTTEILMHKGQGMGGAENVDKAPYTGTTEILMHTGQGMGGLKNIEDTDAPSASNSSQRPKSVRVLPITMQAKEGDSSKNTAMGMLSSALRKLPKQHSDPRFENLSILEIAKHRGVTFPRPRWWTEEEDDD